MSSLISRSHFFDDLFKDFAPGFFIKPLQGESFTSPGQIRLDLKESEDAYTIEAEVPGVPKEDIHVTIGDQHITIKAEVRKESSRSGESFLCSERYFGATTRSLSLPSAINQQQAKAAYDKGVLTLTLPKTAPTAKSRELPIA